MWKKETIKELEEWINRNCLDSITNTPDYILAEMIIEVLVAYNNAKHKALKHMREREVK